jgi:uncharacterized RDD family membrane protein YckC
MPPDDIEYAGFWVRVAASLIDTLLLVAITIPVLLAIYGKSYFGGASSGFVAGPADFLLSWVAPAAAAIVFWKYKQATPGKMVFSARVVDAKTGHTLTLAQSVVRYLGYFLCAIPFGLGLLWVAFDPKKQGWHDKLAGTVVIRSKRQGQVPVKFEQSHP